jgi:hypothetical protein
MRLAASTLAAALALTPFVARADDKQAYLGIFAETTAMKMAGMPAPPGLGDIKLPPGVKLPPQAAAAMRMFMPHRQLSVRLWSPGLAPEDAKASLSIPEGLKLGQKLDLNLYRPQASEGAGAEAGGSSGVTPEFTIKRYWGSSPTVKAGQPEVMDLKGLTPEQQARVRAHAPSMRRATSYFYKPDWTTGYWPTANQPEPVEDDAALQGHFALTSSYTGSVEIDVPAGVNFLAPIEMSSPKLDKAVSLDKEITFRWAGIPGALGLYAQVIGINQDTKTITIWSSAEAKPEMGMSFDYLQMAEVRDLVQKEMVMPGDRTEVTVPAGIFKDADMVMFQMIGYGPGAATATGQPLPRVQTKTTLNIMLGGKKLPRPGPGGFGG